LLWSVQSNVFPAVQSTVLYWLFEQDLMLVLISF